LASTTGCDDDDDGFGDLGSACGENADCRDRCVRGPEWPGGMCTFSCGDDQDCPGGTACVDRSGGVCAVVCETNDDCHGFGFPNDGDCRDTDREGESGEVRVCRG